MGLYETITEAYDKLFPLDPHAAGFLGKPTGASNEAVDVGCATGAYAYALADLGWRARGVDPSGAMIAAARARTAARPGAPAPSFIEGGMLDLDAMFSRASLGLVLCVGNTLPHLASPGELTSFLEKARRVLAPGGRLVLQLLNYERIMKDKPAALPEIKAGGIAFTRRYAYRDDGLIDFETELRTGDASARDVTPLRPYLPGALEAALDAHGFKHHAYADWSKAPFKPETSFALILDCGL